MISVKDFFWVGIPFLPISSHLTSFASSTLALLPSLFSFVFSCTPNSLNFAISRFQPFMSPLPSGMKILCLFPSPSITTQIFTYIISKAFHFVVPSIFLPPLPFISFPATEINALQKVLKLSFTKSNPRHCSFSFLCDETPQSFESTENHFLAIKSFF